MKIRIYHGLFELPARFSSLNEQVSRRMKNDDDDYEDDDTREFCHNNLKYSPKPIFISPILYINIIKSLPS